MTRIITCGTSGPDPYPISSTCCQTLAEDLRSGHNVRSTVFIEVKTRYRADGPEEMRPVGEVAFVEVLSTWRRGIAAVAACPNVILKLGGLGQRRFGFDWHTRPKPIGSEELAAALAPLMQYCIEQFGPDRCMFESNFPVDKVSYSYTVVYNAFKRLSQGYSAAERATLFHDTAVRVYRIGV